MLSTKLSQVFSAAVSHRFPLIQGRALFASATGSPAGESGRDVRDVGTGKVNVPLGQPTKKADTAVGGKGPGAISQQQQQRGHEEVSGGMPKQPKRAFTNGVTLLKQEQGKGGEKQPGGFLSESSQHNHNPGTESERKTGGFRNLEFFPEKSGVDVMKAVGGATGGAKAEGGGKKPAPTVPANQVEYSDEALACKSGALEVGGGPAGGGKAQAAVGGSPKRNFSTSTAQWTVTPAGKDGAQQQQSSNSKGGKVSEEAFQSQTQGVFIDKSNFAADGQPQKDSQKKENKTPGAVPQPKSIDESPKTASGYNVGQGKGTVRHMSSSSARGGIPRSEESKSQQQSNSGTSVPSSKDGQKGQKGRAESIGGADQGGNLKKEAHIDPKQDAETHKAPSIHKMVDGVKEKLNIDKKH